MLQLNEPMMLEGMPDYRAQVSVGLVMFPDDGESAEALLRHADQAMYAAKRAGRNQLQAYTPELGQSMRQTFSLGCGSWGGNATNNNITWADLVNVTWVSKPLAKAKELPSDEALFGKDIIELIG